MRRARGFTLLEMAVGLGMAAIVVAAAAAMMVAVLSSNRRQRVHAELQRDAAFVNQLLTQELRQAGLGVPVGAHVQKDTNTPPLRAYGDDSNGLQVDLTFGSRRLLVAGGDFLGILGDLPRPDSNYAPFGPISNYPTGAGATNADDFDCIAWHNESNGSCVPRGGNCSTLTASTFFANNAGATACTSAGTEITCPWGLRRIAVNEPLQIVDGRGNWSHTRRAAGASNDAAHNNVLCMNLGRSFDANQNSWFNNAEGTGPAGFIGQGWVTTLDRVFYRYVAGTRTLERRQCFGDPDPSDSEWPDANAIPANPQSASPAVTAPVTATGTFFCTAWEIIGRNVDSVAFAYSLADGTAAAVGTDAQRNLVRRVDWTITFTYGINVGPNPVSYVLQGGTTLQNIY